MQSYPFQLPPLPYAYDGLEPYVDAKTMELHHDRHLKTYIDNLNAALKGHPEYHTWSLERLITTANWMPEKLREPVKNNAGGVYNHEFFFNNLTPSKDTKPADDLMEALLLKFGSFEDFTAEFSKAASEVFGSGYAFLAACPSGKLHIASTANQDTLLTRGLYPVAGIDVWEHAYYLKHYNVRKDYIADWFNVVSWDMASINYQEASKREGS